MKLGTKVAIALGTAAIALGIFTVGTGKVSADSPLFEKFSTSVWAPLGSIGVIDYVEYAPDTDIDAELQALRLRIVHLEVSATKLSTHIKPAQARLNAITARQHKQGLALNNIHDVLSSN